MSPEAYKKTQYSEKSDCWAIGVILYEMLIGEQPFKGVDYNTLIKQVATADIYRNLKINSFTKMLLSRLLSIDVQRRADTNDILNLLSSN
jgi:serine/threonine protein kinase